MSKLNKITISGILSAIALSIGSLGTSVTLIDDIHQSEEEIKQISGQLELLDEQLEDLKHENIITRIKNAEEMLRFCDMSIEEKNTILLQLSSALKEATLQKNYSVAETTFNKVIPDLMTCEAFPEFT